MKRNPSRIFSRLSHTDQELIERRSLEELACFPMEKQNSVWILQLKTKFFAELKFIFETKLHTWKYGEATILRTTESLLSDSFSRVAFNFSFILWELFSLDVYKKIGKIWYATRCLYYFVIAFYCLSQEKNWYYLVRSHFIRKFYCKGIVFILFIFAFFVHLFDFYNNEK